jgi:hypothetical protein
VVAPRVDRLRSIASSNHGDALAIQPIPKDEDALGDLAPGLPDEQYDGGARAFQVSGWRST